MKYIDKIRKALDTTIDELKWPAQWKRVKREFENIIDNADTEADMEADRLLDLERQFATAPKDELAGMIKKGLSLTLDLEAARANAVAAKAWLAKLESEAKD